jgi:hypothetical protein
MTSIGLSRNDRLAGINAAITAASTAITQEMAIN